MISEKTMFDGTHLIRVVVDYDKDLVAISSAPANKNRRTGPWEKCKWSQSSESTSPYKDRVKLLEYAIGLLVT